MGISSSHYVIIMSYQYIIVMSLQTEEDSKPGEGWQLVRMEDGRVYYYHQLTRQTTWKVADTWTRQSTN